MLISHGKGTGNKIELIMKNIKIKWKKVNI